MRMGAKTVYCFYYYEPGDGRLVHAPRAATIEAIERLDGVPLRETGLEVDDGDVDEAGYYGRPANCTHHSHRRGSS
jgi:hypothetical protein